MIASKQFVIRYRALGSFFVLVLLGLIFFAFKAIYDDLRSTLYHLRVELPDVGTLDPQNTVYYQGVGIGQVQSIRLEGGKAVADLQFEEPIKLRQGSRLISKTNGGVLSGRYIYIQPSDTGAYLSDSALIVGEFEPSLVETMHKLHDVIQIVAQVSELLQGPLGQSGQHHSWTSEFWQLRNQAMGLLGQATQLLSGIEAPLKSGMGQIQAASMQTVQLADQTQGSLNQIYGLQKEYLPKIDSMMDQVALVSDRSEQMLDSMESSPAYKQIMQDRALFDAAHKLSAQVSTLVQAVRSGEVIPGMGDAPLVKVKNVHLLRESAHESLAKEKNQKK